MSIQETSRKQLKRKLIDTFGLARVLSLPALAIERLYRAVDSDPLRVYFRYKHINLDLHPWFERYYHSPAVKYCNREKAKLYHWISYPDVLDNKPFILEPNDHPLTVIGVLKPIPIEPKDVIRNMNEGKELVYNNPNCKKVIVESTGQWELFERYCPEILDRCEIIRLGTIPKRIDFFKSLNDNDPIVFICLASDFTKKGVDLLLDAWAEFKFNNKHKLILACPNVPNNYKIKAEKQNVTFISKAPLTSKEKDSLYRQAHVAIGPLHTDGGANLFEAMEYGLPLITMRCQRSKDQVMNNNGFVADVPFYFYDEGYGTEWPTWRSFFSLLENAKSRGEFDMTKEAFLKAFIFFNDHPEKIHEMGKGSYDLAINEYSLLNRNQRLREIYEDIMSNIS